MSSVQRRHFASPTTGFLAPAQARGELDIAAFRNGHVAKAVEALMRTVGAYHRARANCEARRDARILANAGDVQITHILPGTHMGVPADDGDFIHQRPFDARAGLNIGVIQDDRLANNRARTNEDAGRKDGALDDPRQRQLPSHQ